MNAISTDLELVLIRKSIRPFRRKREGSTLSTDCHQPKVNHSPIGHRGTNSTTKDAPCEPSPQTKAGFPHDRQQRTKGWSCLNHNLDMGAPGLRKNSRTTRPRNSEQKPFRQTDDPHGLSSHSGRHRALGHLTSGVTTT